MGIDYKIIESNKLENVCVEAFSPEMQEVIRFWQKQGDYTIKNV